jgi:hypothetical protein
MMTLDALLLQFLAAAVIHRPPNDKFDNYTRHRIWQQIQTAIESIEDSRGAKATKGGG